MPAQTDEELQLRLSEFCKDGEKVLLHDGTEREIPRPVDSEQQKEKYSVKKKRHTVKNALITSAACTILFVSQTFSGHVHDKTIADTAYSIPAGFTLLQDSGYQGYEPSGVKIIQPQKKPKGKELTQEQKARNREISADRVRIEHAIGSVKRARIVKDECRLRKDNFVENVLITCAAIHNFRIWSKPFEYLVSVIRQQLTYYIDMYRLLENQEACWLSVIEQQNDS